MRLSVLTWNIHKGFGGMDRRYQLDRIIRLLLEYRPDFAMLQEVDHKSERTHNDEQVELIADALGMRHREFFLQHRRGNGQYGNAILSRHPLLQAENIDLTVGPKKRRGALVVRSRVRVGRHVRTIVLLNLHLGLAGFERAIQLKRLLGDERVAGLHARTPVILGGDLNDLWGTLGPKLLAPAGFTRAGRLVNTYPAVYPVRPLDGIFVRGDVRAIRAKRSRRALAKVASDHLPIIVELELPT